MNTEIDLLQFQQSSGDLKWLPVVAAAFLRQLPQWRMDFDAALAAQNPGHQIDLLHKIKGSGYAVAASTAIETIAQAEAACALAPASPRDSLHRGGAGNNGAQFGFDAF